MSMEFMPGESTARAIAETIFARFRHIDDLPPQIASYIHEALVDAVHDGLQAGESLAVQDNLEPRLAHYTLGYVHGFTDANTGRIIE